MVSHRRDGDDGTWKTPFVLPAAGASNLKSDVISSVVAFEGNKVGIMWSNQNDSAMYVAHHRDGDPDGTWTASHADFDNATSTMQNITRQTGIVALASSETTFFSRHNFEPIP